MVEEGDIVYPGTPLALAGTYDGQKYETRIFITYKILKQQDYEHFKESLTSSVYIDPVFATDQGNTRLSSNQSYRAVQTDEMAKAEMNKRELKSLRKTAGK